MTTLPALLTRLNNDIEKISNRDKKISTFM